MFANQLKGRVKQQKNANYPLWIGVLSTSAKLKIFTLRNFSSTFANLRILTTFIKINIKTFFLLWFDIG